MSSKDRKRAFEGGFEFVTNAMNVFDINQFVIFEVMGYAC